MQGDLSAGEDSQPVIDCCFLCGDIAEPLSDDDQSDDEPDGSPLESARVFVFGNSAVVVLFGFVSSGCRVLTTDSLSSSPFTHLALLVPGGWLSEVVLFTAPVDFDCIKCTANTVKLALFNLTVSRQDLFFCNSCHCQTFIVDHLPERLAKFARSNVKCNARALEQAVPDIWDNL